MRSCSSCPVMIASEVEKPLLIPASRRDLAFCGIVSVREAVFTPSGHFAWHDACHRARISTVNSADELFIRYSVSYSLSHSLLSNGEIDISIYICIISLLETEMTLRSGLFFRSPRSVESSQKQYQYPLFRA